MAFVHNDYLHWYIPKLRRGDHPINLHSSGMPALSPADIEMADGPPFELVPRFEAQLAHWLNVPEDEVCFVPGATGGTLLALLSLVAPGKKIVMESPIYEPMRRQALRLAPVHRFERSIADNWQLPLDRMGDLISDKTGLVMITEPSNPSGTFGRRHDILDLADLAARYGATLLINEVYRGFTRAPSFHGERENIVVVSSFSKIVGAYGFRLGWLQASPTLIRQLRTGHMNMGMPTQPAAAYGIGLLATVDALVERAVRCVAAGVDTVDTWVRATDEIYWSKPMGQGFGCVALPPSQSDDIGFVDYLHQKHGVLAVPGSHFSAPGTMRISWLQAGTHLAEGLDRIGEALRSGTLKNN
ncbi:MAG: pyridoxal phosphate-dependent aminotransferase [Myxococcota bacterium]|nr:pyridoxal phosphate-dependent aminotransferase [Myxococcota bacterium]